MNTFESSLLTELREHVATRAVTARRAHSSRIKRLRWSAIPVGAAAATAVALVLIQSPAAAYAVTTADDGNVVVTIDKLSDASGLQQALQADGINAIVNYDADLTLTPPPAPRGGESGTTTEGGSSSSHGPLLTTNNHPGKSLSGSGGSGLAEQQSSCGTLGPVQVAISSTAATFTIPAEDVGTQSTLHITTGGSQTGFSSLQIAWDC
jgi:hypothetical protein